MTSDITSGSATRITKRDTNWESMFEALVKFRAEHGHCHVSMSDDENLSLGRWVATQRFRRKINALSDERMKRLSEQGFVWSVADMAWERKFDELLRVRKRLGHCNIPTQWRENPKLASWVNNQRHKRKKGQMDTERIARLDAIGFSWSARPQREGPPDDDRATRTVAAPPAPCARADNLPDTDSRDEIFEEKLYNVAPGVYVQHNDRGALPPELAAYVVGHDGDLPPFIPLPPFPVVFLMGNPFLVRRRRIAWKGHGSLHPDVLDYVFENGVLPEWKK